MGAAISLTREVEKEIEGFLGGLESNSIVFEYKKSWVISNWI